MRVVSTCLWAATIVIGCWPMCAQLDEQPPVLRRGGSSIPGQSDPSQNTPQSSSPSNRKGGSNSKKDTSDLVSAQGVIRQVSDKSITVEADDTRLLTCKISAATKFSGPEGKLTADDLDPGMHVKLEAKYSLDHEDLNATSITLENAATKPEDLKTATVEGPPDEEGRPILRRGIPPPRKSSDDDDPDTRTIASTQSSVSVPAPEEQPASKLKVRSPENSADALIEKARNVTAEFTNKLPNFVSQQFTTRYERESKASGWNARDVVTATVVYNDGKEDYQNIRIGNRAGPKDMMDAKGQTSTGDFNTALESLMEPARGAEFSFIKDTEMKHLKAKVYDFTVSHERSDWQIKTAGQSLLTEYSGRIWIDRESGRVLRIERQADKIPEAFPIDLVEQTVEYDFVPLGGRKVLLPTESENLSCQRGTSLCAKNVIEFRNYKEFRGEATIIDFDK